MKNNLGSPWTPSLKGEGNIHTSLDVLLVGDSRDYSNPSLSQMRPSFRRKPEQEHSPTAHFLPHSPSSPTMYLTDTMKAPVEKDTLHCVGSIYQVSVAKIKKDVIE